MPKIEIELSGKAFELLPELTQRNELSTGEYLSSLVIESAKESGHEYDTLCAELKQLTDKSVDNQKKLAAIVKMVSKLTSGNGAKTRRAMNGITLH